MQLVLANAALDTADTRWRAHKRSCAKCSTGQRRRRREDMCVRGGRLYDDWKACQRDVARERLLAKRPFPGQGELFTGDEIEEMRKR